MFILKNHLKLLIICYLVFGGKIVAQTPSLGAKEVVFKMIKSINDLERLKYSLKIIERGKKGFNYYESSVKLNRKPSKIYLYIKILYRQTGQ